MYTSNEKLLHEVEMFMFFICAEITVTVLFYIFRPCSKRFDFPRVRIEPTTIAFTGRHCPTLYLFILFIYLVSRCIPHIAR